MLYVVLQIQSGLFDVFVGIYRLYCPRFFLSIIKTSDRLFLFSSPKVKSRPRMRTVNKLIITPC